MDHVEYTQQEYSAATTRWRDRNQQKKGTEHETTDCATAI